MKPPHRPPFLIYTLGALTLGAAWAAMGLDRQIVQATQARRQIAWTYESAVSRTRVQLAGLLRDAAGDRSMTQNLGWGYSNSVTQSLQSRLRSGELEQLEIFDGSCKSLTKVHLRGALPVPCPSTFLDAKQLGAFFWLSADEKLPILGLAVPLPDSMPNPSTYLVGSMALDDQWMVLFPELAALKHQFDLRLAPASPGQEALSLEGFDPQKRPVAALFSGDWMIKRLGQPKTNSGQGLASLHSMALLATLAILALLWLQDLARRRALGKRYEHFVAWCQSQWPATVQERQEKISDAPSGARSPSSEPAGADAPVSVDFDLCERLVDTAMHLKDERIKSLTARKDSLEHTLQERERDIAGYKQHLSELAELDSLGEQLKRTTRSFLDRTEAMRDQLDDLEAVMSEGLRKQVEQLAAILTEWRSGIHERGARKFLRSLSETAGRTQETSALDDDLAQLHALSQNLVDLSLNASMQGQHLQRSLSYTGQIVGLWHGLSLRSADEEPAADLSDPASLAEQLIRLDQRAQDIRFSFLLSDAESTRIPAVPPAIWASALYHLYLGALEATGHLSMRRQGGRARTELKDTSEIPTVITRLRTTGEKIMLVVSVQGEAPQRTPSRKMAQSFHLDIAKSILAPFGIDSGLLQVLEGPAPCVLSWTTDRVMGGIIPATSLNPPLGDLAVHLLGPAEHETKQY